MPATNPTNTGDGTRPTTDGGVDNIGAGEAFVPDKPDSSAPAKERTPLRRADIAQTKADDSAPLGLPDSVRTTPNTEPPGTASENNLSR